MTALEVKPEELQKLKEACAENDIESFHLETVIETLFKSRAETVNDAGLEEQLKELLWSCGFEGAQEHLAEIILNLSRRKKRL